MKKENYLQEQHKAKMQQQVQQREAAAMALVADKVCIYFLIFQNIVQDCLYLKIFIQASKQEYEDLVNALEYEEIIRKEDKKAQQKLQEQIRIRCEMKEIFAQQVKHRLSELQEQKEREKAYCEKVNFIFTETIHMTNP